MCSTDMEAILHPELLPPDVLLRILEERKLKIDGLEYMTRIQLIEIYNQYCRPQAQRKYRDTPRGKILSKQQEEREKQNKLTPKNTPEKLITNSTKYNALSGLTMDNRGLDNKRKFSETQLDVDNNKHKQNQNHGNDIDSQPPKRQKNKITWP